MLGYCKTIQSHPYIYIYIYMLHDVFCRNFDIWFVYATKKNQYEENPHVFGSTIKVFLVLKSNVCTLHLSYIK